MARRSNLTAEFWRKDAELRREIDELIERLKRERAERLRRSESSS
jgi:hypothetical protein